MVTSDELWQSLVARALDCMASMDDFRWMLGDIAVAAEQAYSFKSIKALATEIRMPNHRALYGYHAVSAFYSEPARGIPLLSWSHYREGLRFAADTPAAKDYSTRVDRTPIASAILYLGYASDNDWPVAKLVSEIRLALGENPRPEPLLSGMATVSAVDTISGRVTLQLTGQSVFKIAEAYRNRQAVDIVIRESTIAVPAVVTKKETRRMR